MKNYKVMIIALVFACLGFIPNVNAANPYSVEMVSNSSNNKVIGTYSSYSEAVKVMNNQTSTGSSVASIYKNGKIINSKYAIFRFNVKSSSTTINLYQTSDGNKYTYTAPYYMTDGAFINSNETRVEFMYNGFRGWVDLSEGNIIPISLLSGKVVRINAVGLNLRKDHSTSSSSLASITCSNVNFTYTDTYKEGSYTWYKITYDGKTGWIRNGEWLTEATGTTLNDYYYRYSSGNLLHRYVKHNGTAYIDDYTNLGPTPSYLTEGTHYFSFDGGVYLYTDFNKMIDDYRNNSYSNSMNKDNPNYPYYLYLPNRSVSKTTAEQLDAQITDKNSKLYGQGIYFKEAEKLYGMNALSAFSVAKNESSSGTSKIAKDKNNVFGWGASDSCPYDCAKSYSSVRDSIMDYAQNGLGSYMTAESNYYFGTHAGTKGSGRNVMYASDALWGEKQAWNAFIADKNQGYIEYKANTIGVSKFGKYNLPVYKDSKGSSVIYYLRNKNSNLKVYNVSVNVIGKEGDYYKIYSDKNNYQYGYVKVSDFNVSNTQPVIEASDKIIKLNDKFNALDGVKATDKEDGNINKISYTSNVDSSKAGEYGVTYTATDNSNFSVSKKINVTVKGESEPKIEVSNKEVSQYTNFDYLDGVKATDDIDGDITNKVTYDGDVDTSKLGEYKVTYSVINSKNKKVSKQVIIKVITNEKPVIEASDKTVYLNTDFDPLKGVKASDKEDGDLTSKIKVTSNSVDTSITGEYTVSYKVTDSANQETTKSIKITVSEKKAQKASGEFYLDYLKEVSGQLQIKGYNVIKGIDNTLDEDITYEIVFKNQKSGDVITEPLDRIIKKGEMTIPVISNDKHDYTYSWFKGDIDVSKLPLGDYTLYLKSTSSDYYSETLVQNMLLNEQVSHFNKNNKYVTITNDYLSNDIPMIFTVRNTEIGKKETSFDTNQYSYVEDVSFNGDSVRFRGATYSVDLDMRGNAKLERKIIFENTETFEKYTYDLDYINKGSFDILLASADKFGKKKELAWFDKTINISNLPKGNYAIYVSNKSNISDYGELTDILLYADFDEAKKTINNKKYEFSLNEKLRDRVELDIK